MMDNVDAESEAPRQEDQQSPSAAAGSDDNVDAKLGWLSLGRGSASSHSTADETEHRYRMNRRERGQFIIINNVQFEERTRMGYRKGSDLDAESLQKDFKKLGFTVLSHRNQTCHQMLSLMLQAAEEEHSNRDCFGVAVLTHGDDGVLFGVDGLIAVDNFVAPIKNCRSLAGKPKIFIFQACRGTEFDSGVEVHDAQGEPAPARRIPLEADFLYAYCTAPGYYAWRNSGTGSWFIQAIHKMLKKYGSTMDFVKLLTRVNHEVAFNFESAYTQADYMTGKKQIPSIVSMLTKDIYFT